MSNDGHDNGDEGMQVNPQRAAQLLETLNAVKQRIQAASSSRTGAKPVRLIAVSKLKPASDILALHRPPPPPSSPSSSSSPTSSTTTPEPQSHFGENYAQELTEKAALLPRSIRWHFIGALQTNKCKTLAQQVPNLWCVSSVDTLKKAERLDEGRHQLLQQQQHDGDSNNKNGTNAAAAPLEDDDGSDRLRILVQVNTSGEASKSGVAPADAPALARDIRDRCPRLHVVGLMTIGAIARSTAAEDANEDFTTLTAVRDAVAEELGVDGLELSMGMSGDFEGAIVQGSDEVRVGTGIFGERPAKGDAKVKGEVEGGKG
ncbi:MAG: hypothetical protein M1822_003729 [Bathelium mastoideum]|nr:MAG: hypothetical protein M1822_003729 [Bathelium mastoideum]